MSFASLTFALVLSSNTPDRNSTNLESLRLVESTSTISLEVNLQESADDWFRRVKSFSEDSECYKKVKRNFPSCVNVDRTIQTTGWRTSEQNYIMLVSCQNHPDQRYASFPASLENLPSGEHFCKDSKRVWIKRDPVIYDTDLEE